MVLGGPAVTSQVTEHPRDESQSSSLTTGTALPSPRLRARRALAHPGPGTRTTPIPHSPCPPSPSTSSHRSALSSVITHTLKACAISCHLVGLPAAIWLSPGPLSCLSNSPGLADVACSREWPGPGEGGRADGNRCIGRRGWSEVSPTARDLSGRQDRRREDGRGLFRPAE